MPSYAGHIPLSTTAATASTVPYGEAAGSINQFMTGQSVAPYLANLPGYAGMVAQRSQNTAQQLSGQLPQDVINQIAQQAAERGIGTGTSGSANSGAAYLRALGLNSLSMMQQGSQNLSTAIADTPVPELFNPASLYVPSTLAAQEQSAAQQGMNQAWQLQNTQTQQQQPDPFWSTPPTVTRRIIPRSGSSFGGF